MNDGLQQENRSIKTLAKLAAAAAILGTVVLPLQSANAWWSGWPGGSSGGMPWSGMADMFGDVDANLSSRGWGRGSGYGYPYSGYGPGWGGYGHSGYGGRPGMVPGYGGYPGGYAPPVMAVPQQATAQYGE